MTGRFQELRTKILAESLETSNEPRWGYFGMTGSLAIGDDSFAPEVTRKVQDEGAEPVHNIKVSNLKRGAGTDAYFKFEPPLCLGDPYQDPGFLQKKGKVTMLDPEAAFKPPGKVKNSINKLGYEYIDHKDNMKDPVEVRERYKDYMPPRQVYTNPGKKGGGGVYTGSVLFGMDEERKFPAYMPDEYDRAKQQRLKELEEHRAKLQEMPMKTMDYGNKHFHNNTDLYNYDIPTHVPREPKPDNIVPFPHEQAFRPSNPMRKGVLQGCIGGIPEYIEDPIPGGAQRKPKVEDAPPPYKLNDSRQKSHPTPSVICNVRNMRNERPSSFVRPTF
mmetsp:Transcript_19105/g.53937  ORF Transcript_19105/g.53937 Transcript_19105/m.53937 type:complete len:331 (+) Transcript_19105:101-1093(+)